MERHGRKGHKVGEFLEAHPAVEYVNHAGLKAHREHQLAKQSQRKGSGSLVTLGITGGRDAGKSRAAGGAGRGGPGHAGRKHITPRVSQLGVVEDGETHRRGAAGLLYLSNAGILPS